MKQHQWIKQLFKAIDDKDASAFAKYLAPACIFRFGNMESVDGRDNIEGFVNVFFDSIASLKHELIDIWDTADGKVCHGQVSYTRKDGTVLLVPFANVLKGNEGAISEYLIFADTSTLYEG